MRRLCYKEKQIAGASQDDQLLRNVKTQYRYQLMFNKLMAPIALLRGGSNYTSKTANQQSK